MHNELKPTKFLSASLALSSLLIVIISFISIVYGTGYEKLIGSCLAIPVFTIYIFLKPTERLRTYWINNLHWFFWWIFSSIAWSINFKSPFVILLLITVIIYKRQKNFIELDSVGNNQAT